jgi:hypothetical protein
VCRRVKVEAAVMDADVGLQSPFTSPVVGNESPLRGYALGIGAGQVARLNNRDVGLAQAARLRHARDNSLPVSRRLCSGQRYPNTAPAARAIGDSRQLLGVPVDQLPGAFRSYRRISGPLGRSKRSSRCILVAW